MRHVDLTTRFARVWLALGAATDGEPVARDLLARWCEPARVYHDVEHLRHCLAELDEHRALASEPEAVEAAIWLHDAVYDPQSPGNEDRSIALWRALATRGCMPAPRIARVAELVEATKHDSEPADDDARLLVDIDLAILGQPPEVFDAYEEKVRREYEWVPDDLFGSVRARLLRRFLDRPALYGTPTFRARFEATARANLERSLRALAG